MKCYLINLDRSPDRLAFFEQQAASSGIVFERMPAIDGEALSREELAASVSRRPVFQPVNPGEAALFLTHRKCWQAFMDSNAPFAAIFEDDAVLAPRAGEILARLQSLSPEVDVVKLETTLRGVVLTEKQLEITPPSGLHELHSWHGGTAAYAVSRAGAQKLLRQTLPISDPVDQVIFNPLSPVSEGLEIAQLVPAVAVQRDILDPGAGDRFGSTIGRGKSRRGLFRHGPIADLKRAWMKHRERRRRKRLAGLRGNRWMIVPFAGRKP